MPKLVTLQEYLKSFGTGELRDKNLARARVAILVALARFRPAVVTTTSAALVSDIEGRLNQVVSALRKVNVLLVPGGAIEHYLPSYKGDLYDLTEAGKRKAVQDEVAALATGVHDDELSSRFGILFETICRLPAKAPVDTDAVLVGYLSDYVHELQGLVINHSTWEKIEINAHFEKASSGLGKLFTLKSFSRKNRNQFDAVVSVSGPTEPRVVRVSHETNAGMRGFVLEPASDQHG